MEKGLTLPLHFASSVVDVTITTNMEFTDFLASLDSYIPLLRDKAFVPLYSDNSGTKHYLLTNEQFEVFKGKIKEVDKLMIDEVPLTDLQCSIPNEGIELYGNMFDVVVMGSGLAALCSSYTILKENPKARVAIIEKEKYLGGNSFKASSGINFVCSPAQVAGGIVDSIELFIKDTMASGEGKSDIKLVTALAEGSKDAWEFFTKECMIDLSKVFQCGGHSTARTHRPKGNCSVGVVFVRALISKLEEIKDHISIFKECAVKALLGNSKEVHGAVVEVKGEILIRCRASVVIIAAGGFANDHTKDSLLKEFVPELENYPSTNGSFAQGEGFKIARSIGARLIDMELVQIHPTGFVDPSNRDAGSKFLVPELLRSIGGILINEQAKRFCNELQIRNKVSQQIATHCKDKTAIMILGHQSLEQTDINLDFYLMKGLIKQFNTLEDLCSYYKLPLENAIEELNCYNESKSGMKGDRFGKTVFPTSIDVYKEKCYYGCEVIPSIHYTMGGIKIDVNGNVQSVSEESIEGLYAAGETTGGLHGKNRLAGNSLMECVVFGRRIGFAVNKYLMSKHN
jgi:flavocytochrome c